MIFGGIKVLEEFKVRCVLNFIGLLLVFVMVKIICVICVNCKLYFYLCLFLIDK